MPLLIKSLKGRIKISVKPVASRIPANTMIGTQRSAVFHIEREQVSLQVDRVENRTFQVNTIHICPSFLLTNERFGVSERLGELVLQVVQATLD